ncbi:hypothetical protein VCZ37_26200 [Bacillus pseudomycoides]|nr:hypothetical protein [Bacillus pseudomycoides]MEB3057383.1 hypothetical protein [Bacillus pseudomycoides]
MLILKRIVGVLSTALLAGTMVLGVSNSEVSAASLVKSVAPYQVMIKGMIGPQMSIDFKNKADFEDYLKEHPVNRKNPSNSSLVVNRAAIHSTFYKDADGNGATINIPASKNPVKIFNFTGDSNDSISSVRTHAHGDYTIIYEDFDGQGRALGLANTGALYNLSSSMGDGERIWNDEVSSATVKSN